MTKMDLALLGALMLAAVRGCWRGFFRESFGLLGLLIGVVAAFSGTLRAAEALHMSLPLSGSPEFERGTAFVAIFVSVWGMLSLCGYALERLFGQATGGVLSRLAGGVVGLAKGTVCVSFAVLFAYLFLPLAASWVDSSIVSRTLVTAAGNVLRAGSAVRPTDTTEQ